MGAKAKFAVSCSVALMGIVIVYLYPDLIQSLCVKFPIILHIVDSAKNYAIRIAGTENKATSIDFDKESNEFKNKAERLFTPQELMKCDGSPDSPGLYLAILGEVFDVEKGAQHYRPGGGYSFFSGRDASRAYVTGDFSDSGLTDDVSNLDDSSLLGIEDWLSFYKEEYILIGKVIGRYYDKDGKSTNELKNILERIKQARSNKWLEENEKEIFPPCNSEWSKEKGSRVWCTKKSGGIDRSWVGVPRKLFKVGRDPRCVCVRDSGSPTTKHDIKDENRGDLDYPNLQEYPNCPSTSPSCDVDHP